MTNNANPAGQVLEVQKIGDIPALFLNYAIFLQHGIWSNKRLRCISFQGQESVSEPFEFQLELYDEYGADNRPFGERNPYPKFDELIGRPVTVGLQCPADAPVDVLTARFERAVRGAGGGPNLVLFNGIVTGVTLEALRIYRVTMKPALFKLSLTNAYCIHRQKNVRDAIADLLDRYRIPYSMDGVSGDDNLAIARIQDWLQAGETDFDFMRRLMAKAHLYYFFVHTGNSHKLVFANRPAYPQAVASGAPLRYAYTAIDELGQHQSDVIFQYAYQQSLVPSSVRGVFTRQEAAWEQEPVPQFQSFEALDRPERGELPFNQYKIYQYGCSNEEVRHFTDSTASSMLASGAQLSGSSYCPQLRSGHQFGMAGAGYVNGEPTAIDPSLEGRRFVLTQVKHTAKEDGSYTNEFQATDAGALVAPFSVQETQQGSVLARVVAHGDMPQEDWRYYTKDYFDPGISRLVDADGALPELDAVGVFVRFSTDDDPNGPPVFVKLAASMQTVPEIGVTVTVARAQDESELPEIQSIVQANGSMVVHPSGWTANTHVGSSYSTSYGDGKSIRFGLASVADLGRAIGIVCAPYDSGKYGNTSYSQGASYSFSTSETTATEPSNLGELYGPHAGATDLIGANESFGSSYSRSYAQVQSSFSKVGTQYSKSTVTLAESISDTTTQKNTATVGTSSSKSTIGSSTSNDTIGSQDSTQLIGMTDSTQVIGMSTNTQIMGMTGSMSATGIQNAVSVTGVSSQNSVTAEQRSCTITGTSFSTGATAMRVSAEATGISTSTSMTGVNVSESMVGMQTGTSIVGLAMDDSMVGVSMRDSTTGISNNISSTLVNNDINNSEVSVSMQIKALETRIEQLAAGVNLASNSATVKVEMVGPDIEMPAIKLVM